MNHRVVIMLILLIATMSLMAQGLMEEGFEGEVFPPAGWTVVSTGNSSYSWAQASPGQVSEYSAGIRGCPAEEYSDWWLISPAITLDQALDLEFFESNVDMYFSYGHHGIWISTTTAIPAADNGPFTLIAEMNEELRDFTKRNVSLSEYTGQTVYIAFRYSGSNADQWYVDRVATRVPSDGIVNEFPYTESFENEFLPSEWNFEVIDSGFDVEPAWCQSSEGSGAFYTPYDGSYMAIMNSSQTSSGATARLILPGLVVPPGNQTVLSFHMVLIRAGSATQNEGIQLETSTNGSDWSNHGPFHRRYTTSLMPQWTTITDTLDTVGGDTIYVALKTVSRHVRDIAIDLVSVELIPNAPAPSAPQNLCILVGGEGVTLSWDAVEGASLYHVYAADDPYSESDWTQITTTSSNAATLTGITESRRFYRVTAE